MKYRRILYALAGLALVSAIGGGVYAIAVQPDPTVRMRPMAWQKAPEPVLNTGVDANGVTLDQWKASGKSADAWRPVETSTVRAGSRMYVLRFQEFRNKMAEPKIQRLLLCGKVHPGSPPVVDNDGLTPFDLGPIDAPTRTDGAAVKNHPTPIPAYVMEDADGKPLAQPRTCLYRSFARFMKNPVQSVEVYFTPVAVTILPPAGAPSPARKP